MERRGSECHVIDLRYMSLVQRLLPVGAGYELGKTSCRQGTLAIVTKGFLFASFFGLFALSAQAQQFSITDGAITTCAGSILDSGGGLSAYGDNEDHVLTICPDAPGVGITLNFVVAALNTEGSSPGDRMVIHDGDDVSAPIIGTFSGSGLQGVWATATPDNPTGCITLHFLSNEIGGGTFSAVIQCETPCYPPSAIATAVNEPGPALVCIDEVVQLDGSTSTAAPGQNIASYLWDLGDGTNAAGPNASIAYDEAGVYRVKLVVTDDAGCVNTQPAYVEVRVSTKPVFAGTSGDRTVCEGATVPFAGAASPITWSSLPVVDLGGPIALPDNVGTPFSNSLELGVFQTGATLTTVNDLSSICVDMEHSFMGDMVLTMTCPNGQSVNLHQQGGGGTFLGDANDTDGNVAVPGTCFTYCFAPNAPNGTWAQCAQAGATPNVVPVSQGTALAPGTYTSVQPLSNLVGCPLNGTWTFTLTDQLAIDNGVICNWSINFNPALYPDLTTFTPVIGAPPDSAYWTGPGVTVDALDGYAASAVMNDPGVYDFTWTVKNNFGCTFDTTITVTVTPAPVIEAGVQLGATCSDPATLVSTIVANPPPPPTCSYTLVLEDSFGDGWSGGAQVTVNIAGTPTVYTLPTGDDATITLTLQTGQSIQLIYTAGTSWNNENSFVLLGPSGNTLFASVNGPTSGTAWQGAANCGPGVGPPSYQWTPSAGVVSPNSATTLTQITSPTTFVVRLNTFGQPWCASTDTVIVQPPSVLFNDSLVVDALCHDSDGTITIISTGTGGPWNYAWTDASGAIVQTTSASNGDVLEMVAGNYQVIVTEGPNGNNCIDTLVATILAPTPLEWALVPNDTTICRTGTAQLTAAVLGGTAPYELVWDQGLGGNGPHAVTLTDPLTYTVFAIDEHGCELAAVSATVDVLDPFTMEPLADLSECLGIPVNFGAWNAAGGNGDLAYDWGSGPGASNTLTVTPTTDTTICVTVVDGCETPPLTSCAELTLLRTPPMNYSADTILGCAPFPVEFNFVDTTGGALITWVLEDHVPTPGDTTFFHTFGHAGTFDVGVEVVWPNGCSTDTTIVDMVQVLAVPVAELAWNAASVLEPEVLFQDLSFPNVVSWLWTFHDGTTSVEQEPTYTYPTDIGGDYPVSLVVRNALGCVDSISRIVQVEDLYVVFIPNAFTPNNDGDNDSWGVGGNDIAEEEFDLRVFDRWGTEVFATEDRFTAWDGTMSNAGGSVLAEGVYAYRLAVRSSLTQQERIILGHVTLLP
jgi:gliding motility-associated-like protein